MAKFFNVLNGIFYVFFGLYWAFMPGALGEFFGWDVSSQLGMHEMRAYGMFIFAFGMLILGATARQRDQRPIVLALIFITLAFFAGRLLGIILDGAGPMLTYYEMGLEIFTMAFGFLAFRLSAPKTLT